MILLQSSFFYRHKAISIILISFLFLLSCTENAQVLSAQPSAFEQDDIKPNCPGISGVTVTSGPSLTVNWAQGSDNYSLTSNITYNVYVRKNSESYDLISPSKIVVGATSTLISNGISVGNTYTLFVTCSDEKGNTYPTGPLSEQSIAVSDTQAPSQITNLSAVSVTYITILLSWSPSDDGAGGTTASNMRYKIYASLTPSVSTAGAPLTTVLNGGTSYLHTGLDPATNWYYKVVAVDLLDNNSVASNEEATATFSDITAPAFPSNTSSTLVTSTTTSSISLSWSAASDNVTAPSALNYRVYRCSGSTTCNPYAGTLLVTTSAGITTYTDSGLSSSTVYVYGITARDSSGNLSTNTDIKVSSTSYSSGGSFYAYPTIDEVNIRAGSSVAVANVVGDASGAGAFPDLLVGANNASEAGSSYRFTGCIFVFPGTAPGQFSSTPTQSFCQPNALASGTQNGLNFGSAIAVGDLDADGIDDIVVSNPLLFRVYIYRTQNSAGTLSIGSTAVPVSHPSSNTTFGTGICIGDSDGVGAKDLFIATTSENCNVACGGVTTTGNLLVFNNTSTLGTFIAPSTLSYRISPSNSLQSAGYSLTNGEVVVRSCAIGNFDPGLPAQTQLVIGSGTVSFGAGAGNDGAVSFYRKTGADTFTFQNVLPTTTPTVTGNQWGNSLATIQLDSGIHELVVGAPNDSSAGAISGAAYLYTAGILVSDFTLTDTGNTFYGGSDFENNAAGSSVAVGDIWAHGDGKQDLVLGSYLDDISMTIGANSINLGQVFTYKNTAGNLSAAVQQTNFDTASRRVRHQQYFGNSLCKGDVNNDGIADVIAGAPYTDYDPTTLTNNNDVGAVYIYNGVSTGEINFVTPSQIIYAPGSQSSSTFGQACVVMDYNADGLQDLVVGSPYRDLVQANRGSVFIYYGATSTPLPSSNSATINSPVAIANGLFGHALTKGDFDNNGYDDLAVGAPGINSGAASSGAVYIYWADNASHAITSVSMTTLNPPSGALGGGTNPYLANTQTLNANLNFGRAMESFKTVGSSSGVDLVICSLVADTGANYHFGGSAATTDLGNCWIYEGKVNGGLGGSYAMMTSPKNEIRYPIGFSTPGNTIYFGSGITKGDWNADGLDDLIICAARQTNLTSSDALAGGCFAYYGTAIGGFNQYNGYNPNATTTRYVPQPDDFIYNPNAEVSTGSRFGEAALMLDINNNGTLDLLIGEPFSDNTSGAADLGSDSGRIYIIRGGY